MEDRRERALNYNDAESATEKGEATKQRQREREGCRANEKGEGGDC